MRRSARRPPAPQSVTSVLQQTGFAYAPNTVGVPASGEVEHDALASPPPRSVFIRLCLLSFVSLSALPPSDLGHVCCVWMADCPPACCRAGGSGHCMGV